MAELYLTGMNLKKQINDILNKVMNMITKDMTESESRAYRFGVSSYNSILNALINEAEHLVIHIPNKENIDEYVVYDNDGEIFNIACDLEKIAY